MLYSDIAHLIYVNETICTAICPSTRFKSIILLPRMTCLVPKLSQNTSYGSEAWCHFLSLKTFLSLTEEEKGTTEDEMAGWHHWPNWRESEWTLGVGDGQGGLASCDSWDRKELDRTERLIWSEWLYNIQIKTSRGVPFLLPSDVYVRSFLYLLYTLIKLYYTKALSDQT